MRPTATVLIADDEEAPRAQLVQALEQAWPEARLVAACVNGADAWDAFLEHEPQVCLLDIRMPGLSGIEVAQRVDGRAQVVFVSAFSDHALAAFDTGAVDYVLKPVEATRLAQALVRVQARLQPASAGPVTGSASTQGAQALPGADPASLQALLAQLAAQLQRPAPLEVIQAGVGKEVRLIRVEDVLFFEADARYTRVVWRSAGAPGAPALRQTTRV